MRKRIGRRAGLIIGLSVVVLVGVFGWTRLSSGPRTEAAPAAPASGVRFTILHTNDLHSRLTGSGPDVAFIPGFHPESPVRGHSARLLRVFGDIRAERATRGERVFVFDSGDFFGGSLFQALSPRPDRPESPELEFFVRAGYDAISLGNHEFDAGEDGLRTMLSKVTVPLIVSNLDAPADHFLRAWPRRRVFSVPTEGAPLRLAVLAGVGIDAARVSQNQRRQAGFIGYADLSSSPDEKALWAHLRREVAQARREAELVVLLWHGGHPEDENIAREVPGLDLILAGHTHQVYSPVRYVNGTWIAQSGRYGETLGVLDFVVADGRLYLRRPEVPVLEIDGRIAADGPWLSRLAEFKARIDPILSGMGWRFDAPVTVLHEDRIRRRELHHPVAVDTLTRIRRALDRRLQTPVDFYVTGMGLIREDLRTAGGRPTELLFSDVARVFPIGFDENLRPGSSVVHFWVEREDVARMVAFLDAYRSVSANFTPAFSEDLIYESRWWGIPLWNRVGGLRFRGRPLDEGPERFHVATSAFAARFLARFPQLSRGFVDLRIRDQQGRPLETPLPVPDVTEATLFAEGLRENVQ